jgi:phosphatidylglycerophosphate synthase
MRKVEPTSENPIDNVIIGVCEKLNPLLVRLGVTPNMVTFVGFLLCLGAMQALWVGDVYKFGTLFLLTYYTDCQDGSLARASNNCSWDGDVADHLRDSFMIIGISIIIVLKYHPSFVQTVPMIVLFSLSILNFGCQQKSYQSTASRPSSCQEEETLSKLINSCPEGVTAIQTRFFGFGTFVIATILWVLYLDKN